MDLCKYAGIAVNVFNLVFVLDGYIGVVFRDTCICTGSCNYMEIILFLFFDVKNNKYYFWILSQVRAYSFFYCVFFYSLSLFCINPFKAPIETSYTCLSSGLFLLCSNSAASSAFDTPGNAECSPPIVHWFLSSVCCQSGAYRIC